MSPRGHDADDETHLDDEDVAEDATAHHPDSGVVAELRAKLPSGKVLTLPLYSLSDRVVVGRGKGSDWQIDDSSLSRQHATFKWTGKDLSVEDMGSANGTRVNGKPARGAVDVDPGATIHLGTVPIVFQLHGDAVEEAAGDPDATRLTSMPPAPIPDTRADIRLPDGAAAGDGPRAEPQVFRPAQHVADPDETTQEWDPRAALVRAPEQSVGTQILDRLRDQWKENRRPFVLAGAAVYLILLVVGWELYDRRKQAQLEEELASRTVSAAATQPTGPVVTPIEPQNDPTIVAVAPAERDLVLGNAIADYDQGHLREALHAFRRLALDDSDAVAKFMVGLLQQKLKQATPAPLPNLPAPTPPAPGGAAASGGGK